MWPCLVVSRRISGVSRRISAYLDASIEFPLASSTQYMAKRALCSLASAASERAERASGVPAAIPRARVEQNELGALSSRTHARLKPIIPIPFEMGVEIISSSIFPLRPRGFEFNALHVPLLDAGFYDSFFD